MLVVDLYMEIGYIYQVRSQAEARKPGLQHHMDFKAKKSDFVIFEQQRRRPACASTQSDQRLVIR